jgi:hypothetical protein
MEGMIFWLATVSDADGLYASELIWTDGDREEAWRLLGSESEVREESRRLGIPARLDGPFTIIDPENSATAQARAYLAEVNDDAGDDEPCPIHRRPIGLCPHSCREA